jgi:IS4 transposase
MIVEFHKDAMIHTSRKIEYWEEKTRHSSLLLTNNFELEAQEIIEIYKHRWQIEVLFKQLKQNFPLKYFFVESVNAIQTQSWVTLIANLLVTLLQKNLKRDWSFSNPVTTVSQMLMCYIDIYSFCENPEKAWLNVILKRTPPPPEPLLFD